MSDIIYYELSGVETCWCQSALVGVPVQEPSKKTIDGVVAFVEKWLNGHLDEESTLKITKKVIKTDE